MDATFLDGLAKSAVSGFEMFKHFKANEQFAAIDSLCPSLPPEGALVDYEKLKRASALAESSSENWLLTSAHINNLMKVQCRCFTLRQLRIDSHHVALPLPLVKIAFTALRELDRDRSNSKAIKILRASLVGDSDVRPRRLC